MTEESVIVQKTKELCQAILEQPEFQAVRQQIDAFMADEKARTHFQSVVAKGEALSEKQQYGLPMAHDEIAAFEQERESLAANPVARGFLEAQGELHKIQESVSQYVSKTLELGRVPNPDDFASGSCGSGCGCPH